MRSTTSLRLAALAAAAALLAACGSDDSSATPGDRTAGAAACGDGQSGGTATLLQYSEPRTLDPAILSNQTATNTLVGNSLFGQLITTTPDGEIGYGLAESLETSDGGTTWQLTLRDGLTFSNGTPFDAAAVQNTWEHIADPATASPAAQFTALIESMNADGLTLDFTLTRQLGAFPETIANSLNWIAEPQALAQGPQAFDADPVGAGPFVLESWQRNGPMRLLPNEDFYDAPRPYLDELVLLSNTDAQQRIATVVSGGANGSLNGDAALDQEAEAQGLLVTSQPAGDSLVYRLNTRIAPFDDVRARQAVAAAVDLTALNEVVYAGAGEVPTTVFPDSTGWNGDVTLPEYDQQAAQGLFDELAEEGNPVEFTLTTFPTTQSRRASEAIQAQLNQYDNVQVELEVLDFPAAIAKTTDRTFQMVPGNLPLDSVQIYNQLYSTSAGNYTGISAPELDAALEAALSAADPTARAEAFETVAAQYSELVPDLIYARASRSVVHDDSLQGLEYYGQSAVRTDTICVAAG